MKRYLILGLSTILILIGIFLLVQVASSVKTSGFGALQVTSNIRATATLDGKSLGQTPVCKCNQNDTLKSGDYTLIVTPDDTTLPPFTTKVTIVPGVLTAVERTFLPGALASASVLTLEKTNSQNAELIITSIPDGAMVTIDGNPQSVTPFYLSSTAASEHEVEIEKQCFEKKTLKVRTVKGYKLVGYITLGTSASTDTALPSSPPSPSITGALLPTPAPTTTAPQVSVKILTTPTGFLRVRAQPNTGASEVGRVNPGDSLPYVDEQTGWFEIKLPNGTSGWVSGQYAQKVTQ